MALSAMRRIQLGKETTYGTLVPATAIFLGSAKIHEKPTFNRPVEERALFAQQVRSYQVTEDVDFSLMGSLSFEQAMYLGAMSMKGGVAGLTYHTTGKGWTYPLATASALGVDTYTCEYGDETQGWVATSVFGQSLTISGAYGGLVTFDLACHAQTMATQAFTAALATPTVENMVAANGTISIDTTWGGLGTTPITAALIDFSWKVDSGRKPKHFITGSKNSQGISEGRSKVEFTATLEFNAGVITERTGQWLAQNTRFVELNFQGSAIAGSMAAINKTLKLDTALVWDDWDQNNERDGTVTVKVKGTSVYDPTGANEAQMVLYNLVATLP